MALTSTSLSGAIAIDATRAVVASATSLAAGSLCKIDDEYCLVQSISGTAVTLMRGINGSVQCAHNTGAPFVHSTSWEDFSAAIPAPRQYSYTSAGALTPAPGLHIIGVGAGGAVAYTLANPPADQPGMLMHIVSVTAQAHTVDLATGYGGSDATDIFTMSGAVGDSITLMSRNGVWSHVATGLVAADTVASTVA
jgi:hypothetical protein